MKRHAAWILLMFMVCQLSARCQTQFKIIRVDTVIQQTVFVTGRAMKTDSIAQFSITFRGMGKRKLLAGLWVTHLPEGKPRRRWVKFILNN